MDASTFAICNRCGARVELTDLAGAEEVKCARCGGTDFATRPALDERLGPSAHLPARSVRRLPPWALLGCGCTSVLALIVVALLAVPAVMLTRWHRESAQELATESQRLNDSGEPISTADLEAFYALPNDARDVTNLYLRASQPFTTSEYDAAAAHLPLVGRMAEDAPIPHPGEDWEQREEVSQLLAQYESSMQLLHQAAEAGGAARYPTDFSQGYSMEMEELQSLRAAARMLILETHVRAHAGDSEGAARSLTALVRLGRSLERHPLLVAQLVRFAIANMSYEAIEDVLPYLDWSDAQLAELMQEISRDDFDTALYQSFLGERAMGLHAFENPEVMDLDAGDSEKVRNFVSVWMKRDRAYFLSQMRRTLDATRMPWPEKLDAAKALEDELKQLGTNTTKLSRVQYLFSTLLLPSFKAAFVATGRAIARKEATLAAVAAERHRRRHGTYPPSLAPLIPEVLQAPPIDPFSGQPLIYRLDEDKLVIYSVGENRKDDGGEELDESNQHLDTVVTLPLLDPQP